MDTMIRHYGRGDDHVGFGRTTDGVHLMYMRSGSVSLHPDSWLVGMLEHIAKLEADLTAAKGEATIGVGDGDGQLFVHGSYEAIKQVQHFIELAGHPMRREAAAIRTQPHADSLESDASLRERLLRGRLMSAADSAAAQTAVGNHLSSIASRYGVHRLYVMPQL